MRKVDRMDDVCYLNGLQDLMSANANLQGPTFMGWAVCTTVQAGN